jgi:hypothetical protein
MSATASWSWQTCPRRWDLYGQRRPKPQGEFARKLEGDCDAQIHCRRQAQHPAAALTSDLLEVQARAAATSSLTVWGRSPIRRRDQAVFGDLIDILGNISGNT